MENNRYDETHVRCDRCKGEWNEPRQITDAQKVEIADLVRAGNPIHAIQLLRQIFDVSLRDGKAIIIHFPRTKNQCEKCGSVLVGEGRINCSKCKSINYNW